MDPAVFIPLSVLAVFILVANGAVCLLVSINRSLRTFTNGFVVSLAVSDLFVGITLFLQYALAVESPVTLNVLYTIALVGSVANLSAVTFDRHLACTKPFHYSSIIAKHFMRIISFCWLIAVTCALLPLCWLNSDISAVALRVYQFCILIFVIATPHSLIFLCYLRIFTQVHKTVKREKELAKSVRRSIHDQVNIVSSEAKIAKIFGVITVMFIISWFPIIWTTFVVAIDRRQLLPEAIEIVSPFTLAFGSLINPMLYSFMKPDFKIVCRRLITGSSPKNENRSRILNQDLSTVFSTKTASRLNLPSAVNTAL